MVSRALDLHEICSVWLGARKVLVPSIHEAISYYFFRLFLFLFFLFIIIFYLTSVSFGELRCMISIHVLKVAPVFISIHSINLHAMRFLSYEQTLFFFNFIRMQFDLPTKTDCFLTVKVWKHGWVTNLLVEGNWSLRWLTNFSSNRVNNFSVLAKMHMHIICRNFLRCLLYTSDAADE